jgi:hypothetical protein
VKLYARLTEQQITNDCRIILESAAICQKTKERSTFVSRKKGAKGRYEHLQTLVPFADDNQKPLIKQTKKAMMQIERMK